MLVAVRRFVAPAVGALLVGALIVGLLVWSGGRGVNETTTPQALAAAAIRHVPAGPALLQAAHSPDDDPANRLLVRLTYDLPVGETNLVVEVHPKEKAASSLFDDCRKAATTCQYRPLVDGTRTAVIHLDDALSVSVKQPGGDMVVASVVPSYTEDGPLGVDTLSAIAADPLVGLKTSRRMIEAGNSVVFTS